MKISVQTDIKDLNRQLTLLQREQIPFATVAALTETAKNVQVAQKDEMKKVFFNPRAFTLNSTYVKPAKKKDYPNAAATVWLKDWTPKGTPAAKYLKAQIEGGDRDQKRSEALLRYKGLLDRNEKMVPSRYMKLDRHGNVSRINYNKILSDLGAQFDRYQNQRDEKKKQYFISDIKPGLRGIFKKGKSKKEIEEKRDLKRMKAKMRRDAQISAGVNVGPRKPRLNDVEGPKISRKMKLDRAGVMGPKAQKRSATKPQLQFIITKGPFKYKKRYDFAGVTQQVVVRDFRTLYIKWLNHAIRTQKWTNKKGRRSG